jgi:hypothetical protein
MIGSTKDICAPIAYFFLITAIFAVWLANNLKPPDISVPSSPSIDRVNAAKKILNRYKTVRQEYENVLGYSNWTTLRSAPNISIEKLPSLNESSPDYLKTVAFFNIPPIKLYDLFRWENFQETQYSIDPFHENVYEVYNPAPDIKVIRRTTKRPMFFSKREFYFGMPGCIPKKELIQPNEFNFINPLRNSNKTKEAEKIPKKTLISTLVNVNLSKNTPGYQAYSAETYVRAYQDFVAWFVPYEGGEIYAFIFTPTIFYIITNLKIS